MITIGRLLNGSKRHSTLYSRGWLCKAPRGMKKKLFPIAPILLSSLLLAGCTTTITNLTPSTQKRQADGLYPVEVELDTRNRGIRQETIQPYVLVGTQIYPMQQTLNLKNRWETLVPVPADKEFVNYQFKFNYDQRGIPRPTPGSRLSRPFQLQVLDK